ncbi:hypothetical protein DYB32_005666 [Aphanomyces invadans]|uniref:Uncharacterized protein n=1 Tax=Aphanomyces invadans TaxID=157072 RepID=A0A3R6Z567_9STRA|nr:hypothetical protein DYB32_005666 [Aphanomyces invadans]
MGSGSSCDKEELKAKTEKSVAESTPVSRRMSEVAPALAYQNMTTDHVNKMLEAYANTTLELSLAQEADFTGFLAQHNLPPFQAIPNQVYKLWHLIEVNFSHNQLACLDDAIGDLTQLEVLDIASNRLTLLPDSLCKLTRLSTLIVSENQLTSLPCDLGHCASLKKLICFKNQLTTLPDSIGGCQPLEEVNFFNNKLTSLSPGFYDLVNLTELNIALQLYRNALKEIPDTTDLTLLTDLDANTNQIKTIPDTLCCPQSSLRSLNLRKNRLLSLPPALGNLKNMEILNIGGNPISSPVPAELANMTKLMSFLVDDSNLTVLPKELASMTSLVRVDVGSRIDHSDDTTKYVMNQLELTCDTNKGWLKQS